MEPGLSTQRQSSLLGGPHGLLRGPHDFLAGPHGFLGGLHDFLGGPHGLFQAGGDTWVSQRKSGVFPRCWF